MTGYLTLTVQVRENLEQVAQRVLCWAGADAWRISTTSAAGGRLALTIPDSVFNGGHGPLLLKPGGPDIAAMNVPRLYQSLNVGNGDALSLDPDTCHEDTAPAMTMSTVDGYTFTCEVNSGVVVDWGDGATVTSHGYGYSHKYAAGKYRMTFTQGASVHETWLLIPSNVGIATPSGPCPPCPPCPEPAEVTVEPASTIYGGSELTFTISNLDCVGSSSADVNGTLWPIDIIDGLWQDPINNTGWGFLDSHTVQLFFNGSPQPIPGTWRLTYYIDGVEHTFQPFTVELPDNPPIVTDVSPTEVSTGDGVIFEINGTNLTSWGTVYPDSIWLVANDGSGEQMQGTIAGSGNGTYNFEFYPLPAPGTYQVFFNLDAWYNAIGTPNITIKSRPPLTITSISPPCVTAYSGATFTVNGTGFETNSVDGFFIDDRPTTIYEAGNFQVLSDTQLSGIIGEIEHDGPGDWLGNVVVTSPYGEAVKVGALRVKPPGQSC